MDFQEFITEDCLIEIVPKFRYNKKLSLVCGDFGPFLPSVPTRVPMWMAVNLYRRNKCSIISPAWVHELPMIQETQEKSTTELLSPPDEHWKETLKIFEKVFGRSIQCQDLIERREAILKKAIHELFHEARDKKVLFIGDITFNNATPAELILIKEMISKGFQRLQELKRTALQATGNKHKSQWFDHSMSFGAFGSTDS